ncbi:DNA phosphorothioation system restriction enzyme [Pleurocapsa sp. CCALA 161]|uniref:DNA phosphorothioation system restriction enzyme n=1 Tax=Pleurocapsa sp. CCALA 161 TaxID=2107688 RepID=UPI000D056F9A|nr:DNA phosphorothioation system restriction enzyme [Pleurocapsa sp. CCALA 161]PSB05882.1 DNA phosphorothioation system restriction enzyme [Pleurocapsa sp. CCALA 161]
MNQIDWHRLATLYRQKYLNNRVKEGGKSYQDANLGMPIFPHNLKLRKYQHQAVANWLDNKGRGTLKMATGSGKTIIALAIAQELYQQIKLQVLLIVCPTQHLVSQWSRECQRFNLRPIIAMKRVDNWQGELSNQLYNLPNNLPNSAQFLTIITTNSTLISDAFQSQLQYFPAKTLIVGDEAHNLGSTQSESRLPRNIGLRLALSATPERQYDELGTEALLDYFGKILQPEFTLADAIKQGALAHYLYYPILVELTTPEAADYAKLTKRIGWTLNKNPNFLGNDTLTSLLNRRSRLIANAANKLTCLEKLMRSRLNTTHTIFYCGDGHLDDDTRQIDAVTHLLGKELGYRVNTYTTNTSLEERERLRRQFESGELQGLIAIRCLDEGVDIPAIKTAVILASSSNSRQFIQRRGRILRPHPSKQQATLFDTIVIPPNLDRDTWEVEKNLLRKELLRFITFAELADNAEEATTQLFKLQEQYEL